MADDVMTLTVDATICDGPRRETTTTTTTMLGGFLGCCARDHRLKSQPPQRPPRNSATTEKLDDFRQWGVMQTRMSVCLIVHIHNISDDIAQTDEASTHTHTRTQPGDEQTEPNYVQYATKLQITKIVVKIVDNIRLDICADFCQPTESIVEFIFA